MERDEEGEELVDGDAGAVEVGEGSDRVAEKNQIKLYIYYLFRTLANNEKKITCSIFSIEFNKV